ncbi:MAG: hypothetical protein WEH44_10140 [Pirellulaceae bacterium]
MSDWVQNLVAIAACMAAACFVAWRAWKAFQGRSSGCGSGCGSCPSSPAPVAKTLLAIDAGGDNQANWAGKRPER